MKIAVIFVCLSAVLLSATGNARVGHLRSDKNVKYSKYKKTTGPRDPYVSLLPTTATTGTTTDTFTDACTGSTSPTITLPATNPSTSTSQTKSSPNTPKTPIAFQNDKKQHIESRSQIQDAPDVNAPKDDHNISVNNTDQSDILESKQDVDNEILHHSESNKVEVIHSDRPHSNPRRRQRTQHWILNQRIRLKGRKQNKVRRCLRKQIRNIQRRIRKKTQRMREQQNVRQQRKTLGQTRSNRPRRKQPQRRRTINQTMRRRAGNPMKQREPINIRAQHKRRGQQRKYGRRLY